MIGQRIDQYRDGGLALLVTIASLVVGVAYVAYLKAESFPPDAVWVIPFVWLVGALAGLTLGLMALVTGPRRLLGGVSALLSVPNVGVAAVYALGALIGG